VLPPRYRHHPGRAMTRAVDALVQVRVCSEGPPSSLSTSFGSRYWYRLVGKVLCCFTELKQIWRMAPR